jgi:endonuclease III
MTAAKQPQSNRKQQIAKLHKVLKGHYKQVVANTGRSMLEQVLFACCLENARHDEAEKAFSRLLESAFDLNEIRVTTVAELAETLHGLPDPARAALALRRVLQAVFESTYSFSLDHARKHSIAHGIKTLEHLHGIPPFVVQHVAATALGGHVVALDLGAMSGLYLAGIISREEYDAGKVAGLERLIPKKIVLEFNSLVHQFGADVVGSLHGATVKKILQAVNAAALKERFPKRGEPLPPPNPPPPAAGKESRKAAEAAQTAAGRAAGRLQACGQDTAAAPRRRAQAGRRRHREGRWEDGTEAVRGQAPRRQTAHHQAPGAAVGDRCQARPRETGPREAGAGQARQEARSRGKAGGREETPTRRCQAEG